MQSDELFDYFLPGKNGKAEYVSTQEKVFHIIVVFSKPFIENIGSCY